MKMAHDTGTDSDQFDQLNGCIGNHALSASQWISRILLISNDIQDEKHHYPMGSWLALSRRLMFMVNLNFNW